MSEITKLYKNAGIGKKRMCDWVCEDSDLCSPNCQHYKSTQLHYPPFTAEKQIKILKLILKKRRILDVGYIIEQEKYHCMHYECAFNSFEEALCADINYHWQDLTEAEKQRVIGILE